jgi:hypothetical protein
LRRFRERATGEGHDFTDRDFGGDGAEQLGVGVQHLEQNLGEARLERGSKAHREILQFRVKKLSFFLNRVENGSRGWFL